ncbi:type II toxin-antitoxin system PemK/MazF family toxin [Actinobacteria bacterium YIM 96077]|uniref:Type II toxin-antitoxin system PemK/MazF family toxin n=1 Tax=Phytoactinopolyspora halophila TaxID=1981511 RepID=A0A329R2Q7_9ACTN|nr:type II toxin-antitoxin system PemK/MazF family toxin [Phytoactinopolyspora halophila]AYY11793.1 type II toxin-antitoxin system PemK/MazF family toxin [Actinobacteria bacterium YIM 96077]RAW17772.1 type II toxin-antitoxin system PemK/MazF family toxin [Phytoactinopolyspora halophila]
MRPIHIAKVDKSRPVVLLTREAARPYMTRITVAPITSTVRGLSTEVPVGAVNGLDDESVISLDNVATITQSDIGRLVGYLTAEQEITLAHAIIAAYDLDV